MDHARLLKRALGVALGFALAGCGAERPNDAAVCLDYQAGRSRVEVVADGTVTSVLGTRPGRVSPHEGFLVHLNSGCDLTVRVESNVDFTGPIPLRRGDRITVKGEYAFYQLGGVIHWTHRATHGYHPSGYVRVAGREYE